MNNKIIQIIIFIIKNQNVEVIGMDEIKIEGLDQLNVKLKQLENLDIKGIKGAIGQSIRTSTMERFQNEEDPEKKKWVPSIRTKESLSLNLSNKILTKSSNLRTSIRVESSSNSVEVGTNTIYAATHQFGDKRIVRAKGKAIKRNIPKRSFLGINEEDIEEIKSILEDAIKL